MTPAIGSTPLAPGQLAALVTTLEMRARPAPRPVPPQPELTLLCIKTPDVTRYRALYRRVGQDYLWFSRLQMSDAALAAHLAQDTVEVWSVQKDGADLGLLELHWQEGGDCELAFFGLSQELIGGGVGRWLMSHAIERAFSREITRFYVHTCTLDSPQALAFYIRSGFVPYAREIEVMQDPRLIGLLDRSCAPQIPLIDPAE